MLGQVMVNGAIVAADVGLLVPGTGGIGLELNYDNRSRTMLNIQTEGAVSIRRRIWNVAVP